MITLSSALVSALTNFVAPVVMPVVVHAISFLTRMPLPWPVINLGWRSGPQFLTRILL